MNAKTLCVAVTAVLLVGLAGGHLSAAPVIENNVYDFSQTANGTWTNYCVPTVAGDLVYHFGNTVPALVQGNLYGPGNLPGSNNGATTIIGGLSPPNNGGDVVGGNGPPTGSLAALMQTTHNGGTTLDNLKTGLDSYLAANSSVGWNTHERLYSDYPVPPNQEGLNFYNALTADLAGGADVILVIAWKNGQAPDVRYQLPTGYDAGELKTSAIGHAFEMYGYDANTSQVWLNDPANNGGAHSWAAEGFNPVVAFPVNDGFTFNVGGATAIAYGAVVVSPTPEPSTLLLLAVGGLGTFGLARRTRVGPRRA
ncbi:MAG: PEP-CTERM sorting domain-containing protein [Thermoguttaceae bacterium]